MEYFHVGDLMRKNLISIIIPVYNVSKYLPQCLDSVINQTYENIEIIIVNDGSTDNSLEICEKYRSQDSRIKIIDKKNEGLSSARNAGIKAASCEWISFVDSDDYIDLNTYEIALNTALEKNAKLVQWNLIHFTETKTIPEVNSINEGFVDLTENNELSWIFNTVYTKLIHRDLFDKFESPFVDGLTIVEDLCFSYRLFNRAGKFYYLDKNFYHYRIREDSIMHSMGEVALDNAVTELKKLENEIKVSKKQMLINSMRLRKIEVRNNYIHSLTVPNPKKFRKNFKETNPYFLKHGKIYIAAILGFDFIVKFVKTRNHKKRKI